MAETNLSAQAQPEVETLEANEFSSLLQREFKPKSDQAKESVENAVRTLAEQALQNTTLISKDVIKSIESMIAALDQKLSQQLNQIMHHPDFQQLESAWRGLHYLVNNTETDEMLKIRVLNIAKKDLHKTLKKFKGTAWDQSPIFKKMYEEEYGQFGGEPYGCLVGDYHFDHSPVDVELLQEMSKVSAAAHCPFIAGAAPTAMQMDSWQELANPRDLTKIFQTPEYAAWRSLRESEDSRYLGLAMPRFLARRPYGAKSDPVDEFDFEEDVEGADHNKYIWANAAYAMATNINRAFKLYGWCTRIRGIESGGAVENLPTHTFAQSLQKPAEYDDPDATANANLSARLPYLFATCRFAHYLKCMVRDKIGSFKERSDMQYWLNSWIMNYVVSNPESAGEETKAKKPLSAAEVVVEEVEGNPGYYTSKFFLRPHYQLEGLTVSLRLVSKLPSGKGG